VKNLGKIGSKTLSESLFKTQNNLDLFRLLLALGVLFGHAITLAPNYYSQIRMDIFQRHFGYPIAAFSVKGFFLVSGILVTNSLITSGSILKYSLARFFRIFPALFGVVTFCALILGPVVSNLGLGEYFKNSGFLKYMFGQLTFRTWASNNQSFFNLPGVFEQNHYPNTVNASLWSLTPEIFAYLILGISFVIFLKSRTAIAVIAALVIIDTMATQRIIFTSLPKGVLDFSDLPFFFSVGILIALNKERIRLNVSFVISIGALAVLLRNELIGTQIKLLFVLLALLSLFLMNWNSRLVPKRDLSFGIYLYGFPISQFVSNKLSKLENFNIYFIIILILTLVMAYLSCIVIETPFIKLGRKVFTNINNRHIYIESRGNK